MAKWSRILAVRAAVQKELETLRQGGKIGSSLQAEVAIGAPGEDYDALASLGDDLRFVLITSAATRRARRRARDRRSRPARTRSASAAGTIGPTSARTRRIRRCAAAAWRTCSDRASVARSRDRMRHADCRPRSARWLRWLWLAAGVIVADQVTKAAVLAALREGGGWAVTGFFSLVLTYNTGAAFSFLADGVRLAALVAGGASPSPRRSSSWCCCGAAEARCTVPAWR